MNDTHLKDNRKYGFKFYSIPNLLDLLTLISSFSSFKGTFLRHSTKDSSKQNKTPNVGRWDIFIEGPRDSMIEDDEI